MYNKEQKRDISVFMFSSFHFLWFVDFMGLWSVWHSSHTLSPSDDVIGPLEDQLGATESLLFVDKLKRKFRKIEETMKKLWDKHLALLGTHPLSHHARTRRMASCGSTALHGRGAQAGQCRPAKSFMEARDPKAPAIAHASTLKTYSKTKEMISVQ